MDENNLPLIRLEIYEGATRVGLRDAVDAVWAGQRQAEDFRVVGCLGHETSFDGLDLPAKEHRT